MKKSIVIMLITLFAAGQMAFAKSVVTKFKVEGQCGECKERIEKALDMKGISFAEWDKNTKMLTVRYNDARFSEDDIHKLVSELGYSTSKKPANKAAEAKLPGCCKPGKHKCADE